MTAPPKPPASLRPRGRAFWRRIVGDYVLSAAELLVLEAACGTLDAIHDLQLAIAADGLVVEGSKGQRRLYGAVPELRQQRLALGRLLSQLDLPNPDDRVQSPAQARARKAAETRWRLHAERTGRRRGSAA